MTGDPILREDLFAIFEAARFAPSSYNEQPWRLVYAQRGTPEFDKFKNVLMEVNWNWAQKASALVLIASKALLTNSGESNKCSMFDSGCAWGYMALEATRRGYVTHAMAGFIREEAVEQLAIPDGYFPLAVVAIGKIAPRDFLPDELAEGEYPSPRKPQSEFVFEGMFPSE
jgi:nitroreductase